MAKKEKKDKSTLERINNTILGGAETAFVHWFERLAPDWVSPDMMTGIGMVGSLAIIIGYALTSKSSNFLWLASLGFVLNWFGDSLDGNLARIRHIERPRYGYFLDHTLDTITMALVFIGVGLTPHIDMRVALGTFTAYLMMNIYVYVNAQVNKKFKISYAKLGPTEGRLMFIIANALMFFLPMKTVSILNFTLSYFDLFFCFWIVILLLMFTYNVFRNIIILYKEDPPRKYTRPHKSTGA